MPNHSHPHKYLYLTVRETIEQSLIADDNDGDDNNDEDDDDEDDN